VTGEETDTFSRTPAPAQLEVDAIDSSGKSTHLATVALPATTIDLGKLDVNTIATVTVSGVDASGNALIRGASLPFEFGALDGLTVPLFVQRTGELARMPNPLSDARQAPALSIVQNQYLFVAGGDDAALGQTTQFYDFADLTPFSAPPRVPRVPRSLAFVGPAALLIDEQGGTYFDFSSNAYADAKAPAGGSFADVAGGATVVASNGVEYIVGGTRTTGGETARVLIVDPSDTSVSTDYLGKLSWGTLTAPRFGATATWAPDRGLVVAGGSATAVGAEIVPALPTTTGVALPFPPDPSMGAGSTLLDSTTGILVAGGVGPFGDDAGARVLSLGCQSMCTPTKWSALPLPVTSAQAFTVDPANAVVVGNDKAGLTHVFRLTSTSATEIPTKVPHKGARSAVSPLGNIIVVGGAPEIESFIP
jgi:hypothetical protein